ncbi:hypothetical protein FPCIR_9380 [Fusarium pseudocircinatum]|uniref:Uncharacterized protein n=1 Tax=Fusarium pseudocircinatum TaxID=56676 RepID=A0A8H5L0W4_9HYPO|nr:hypothetical protein FPCIR_9380 [Fusarium pseudocircinatum]
MGSMAPDVSLQTLSAADGLLAGLIYLSTAKQATAQSRITKPFLPHNLQSWKHLEVILINLENVRQRLRALVLSQGLEGIDVAPNSFENPFVFFQVAISSLRNTLIGQPPSTLIDVLALYCLSHVVSYHLRSSHNSVIFNTQLCIDQWANTIIEYDHQQAFVNLIQTVFPEIPSPTLASHFCNAATSDYTDPLYSAYNDAPFELSPVHDYGLISHPPACSSALSDCLSLPEFTCKDQAARNNSHITSGEIPLTRPQTSALLGPCGSALVINLKLFLEQRGELFQILSGRWVTAKHQYSPSSAILDQARAQCNDVISCIQRMRQGESFQEPFSLGILAIVDLFTRLGYLQTPEDIQEYMIIVGKEVIPDREFVKFCPLVVNTLGVALHSAPRGPSTPFTAGPELSQKEVFLFCLSEKTLDEYGSACLMENANLVYSAIAGTQSQTQVLYSHPVVQASAATQRLS